MQVTTAVAGIERFHGYGDQEIALSIVADAFATCRMADAIYLVQGMGLITAGPLAVTIITGFGAGGKRTSLGTRDLHAAIGSTTAALYFTTAYFAIRAPKN